MDLPFKRGPCEIFNLNAARVISFFWGESRVESNKNESDWTKKTKQNKTTVTSMTLTIIDRSIDD